MPAGTGLGSPYLTTVKSANGTGVGVTVEVTVGTLERVEVAVGVLVRGEVAVGTLVSVGVLVRVGVLVSVAVGMGVRVGVIAGHASSSSPSNAG